MSSNAVKNYDPAEVSLICGGAIISGFADDEFISVERNEQAYTRSSGADGEGTRSKSNDRSGLITLTLKQTSESNDVLSGFALADELNNGGTFPFLMKDNNGTTLHASEVTWVQKMPASARAKEAGEVTWVLESNELTMFVGGTTPLS